MKTRLTIFRFSLILCLLVTAHLSNAFRVVGYATSWSPATIQYSKLTHINYSFALPQYGGRLKAIENPNYLRTIVSNAHANGVKVYIAIGGWSDNGAPLDPIFESIAANAGARANLINDALYLINTYNLDGVDMDWEYPGSGSVSNNFTTLMKELSNALKPRGKGLSFAGPADSYNASGIASAVFQYVDFVNIMAYDGTGSNHSTYQFAVNALNLYKSKGCPASKCVVGVPAYARPSWRSYADLIASGASANSDFFNGDGYNGIPTIKQKTQMAIANAGGIMMWALAQDATGSNSLLSAINDVVKAGNNNNSGSGVATFYKDCNYGGKAVSLPVGNYNLSSLNAKGILNDDISSLKVNSGYEVQLYWDDNFSGSSLVVGANNSCLVNNGWNDKASSLRVRAVSSSSSRTIQAESYNAMSGVFKENTTDAGGGQNVGGIDQGDWMAYNNINFPSSGTYKVEYRVSSLRGGGKLSLDLNAGSKVLGAVNIPSTGGWQNWTTVSHNVSVTAGTYNVGVYAVSGGFNLNWIKITKVANAREEDLEETLEGPAATAVRFYPNPAENALTIELPDGVENAEANITDLFGNKVKTITLAGGSNTTDITDLAAGIYILSINTSGGSTVSRFVKQ